MHHIRGISQENNVRVLELNLLLLFVLMEQVVLNLRVLLQAVATSIYAFELKTSSHESSKITEYFAPLFFNKSVNLKFTPWKNSIFQISVFITS